jgi:predicted metal-dependent peptidase
VRLPRAGFLTCRSDSTRGGKLATDQPKVAKVPPADALPGTKSAEHKLQAARTRLLLERPFLGTLLLHLPLVAAQAGCRTLATDARNIYYSETYVASAVPGELQFMLAHEVLHCALQHLFRRRHRVRAVWDAACDHAVNQLLVSDGFKAPGAALLDERFRGLAAEEIYPLLNPSFVEPTIDAHLYQGAGDVSFTALGAKTSESASAAATGAYGTSLDRARGQSLAQLWQQRLVGAAQQALASGRMSMLWQTEFERHTHARLPWRALLARFLSANARHDFSFQRISRRSEDVLLPSLAHPNAHIVVALDTSGSISRPEIQEFIDEVDALKSQLRVHVSVHACDMRPHPNGPWEFAEWQPLQLPEDLSGGGGTRFTPVFAWLDDAAIKPDCLIYFTDALGEFPSAAPDYPVMWLVKGNGKVPWGERVQLD